jgi:tRNA A37 threonylcarbamoyladenosine synthetase subunit TsaC/SUA5/YrdC
VLFRSGFCGFDPSTIVDMSGDSPVVVRVGKGDASLFAEE